MNTLTNPATPNQREAIGLALARLILPEDMTEAEAALLLKKIEEVVAAASLIVTKIIRPPPKPAMEIKVVAEFKLGNMKLEAVLVHWEGEECVLGKEAIRRADTDGRVIRSETDWQHVHAHRAKLPAMLNKYWLATARLDPDDPRNVSSLVQINCKWHENWDNLDRQWGRRGLVLRRRT